MPKVLCGLSALVKDDVLHCIGGRHEAYDNTDVHFSVKMREFYIKNGGLLIFENWFRFCGFKLDVKGMGKMVEDYAGNLW